MIHKLFQLIIVHNNVMRQIDHIFTALNLKVSQICNKIFRVFFKSTAHSKNQFCSITHQNVVLISSNNLVENNVYAFIEIKKLQIDYVAKFSSLIKQQQNFPSKPYLNVFDDIPIMPLITLPFAHTKSEKIFNTNDDNL